MAAYSTSARFSPHALEVDRLGIEALGAAVGGHLVGFARSTDTFAPQMASDPIPPGKMENSKGCFQLGCQRSLVRSRTVGIDVDWTKFLGETGGKVKDKMHPQRIERPL